MHNPRIYLSFLLLLGLNLLAHAGANAADEVQISNPQVDYEYGEKLTIKARVKSEEPIEEVVLIVNAEGSAGTKIVPARVDSESIIVASYDLNQNPLPVFSQVEYQFRIEFRNRDPYESQIFSFIYKDNRFDWEALQDQPFRVHWYSGDLAFAQEVLNTAQAGHRRVQSFLHLSPPADVDIYVYKSAQDLQSTLNLSGQTWVAGHADPELGMIMVSLPPGPDQKLEMERQIPHELMHVMLFHTTGSGYDHLPVWFVEGLASISELYPNPDYAVLLEHAHQKDSLIPILTLCNVFPRDASSALLAYAESASFSRYLFNQFGTPGLEELRQKYAAGLDCEQGTEQAFNIALNRLDHQWRQETFTDPDLTNVFKLLGPWIVLMVAILAVPFGLIIKGFWGKSSTQGEHSSSQMPLKRSATDR